MGHGGWTRRERMYRLSSLPLADAHQRLGAAEPVVCRSRIIPGADHGSQCVSGGIQPDSGIPHGWRPHAPRPSGNPDGISEGHSDCCGARSGPRIDVRRRRPVHKSLSDVHRLIRMDRSGAGGERRADEIGFRRHAYPRGNDHRFPGAQAPPTPWPTPSTWFCRDPSRTSQSWSSLA